MLEYQHFVMLLSARKKQKITSDTKFEIPDAKNLQTVTHRKTEKPKFFGAKPQKNDLKMPEH